MPGERQPLEPEFSHAPPPPPDEADSVIKARPHYLLPGPPRIARADLPGILDLSSEGWFDEPDGWFLR